MIYNLYKKKFFTLACLTFFTINLNRTDDGSRQSFLIGLNGTSVNYEETLENGNFGSSEKSNYRDLIGINIESKIPITQNLRVLISNNYSSGSTEYNGRTWGRNTFII